MSKNIFKIYPNPGNKFITIEGIETDNLNLVDVLGIKGTAAYKNADDFLEELAKDVDPQKNPEKYEELRLKGIDLVREYNQKALSEKKLVIAVFDF